MGEQHLKTIEPSYPKFRGKRGVLPGRFKNSVNDLQYFSFGNLLVIKACFDVYEPVLTFIAFRAQFSIKSVKLPSDIEFCRC